MKLLEPYKICYLDQSLRPVFFTLSAPGMTCWQRWYQCWNLAPGKLQTLREEWESLDLVIRDKLLATSISVSVEIAGIRQVSLFAVRGATQGLNDLWMGFFGALTGDLGGDT